MNIPQRFESYNQGGFYQQPSGNNRFYLSNLQNDDKNVNKIQTKSVDDMDSDLGSDIAISHFNELHRPFTYEQNFRPVIQGWANKKTLNATYQQRYFVLTPTRILYYTNETKSQPKGCFNLVSLLKYNLSIVIEQMQIKLKISPQTHTQEFLNRYLLQMAFTSKAKLTQWVAEINNIFKQLNVKYQVFGKEMLEMYPEIPIQSLVQMNQKIASQYNHNFWNKIDISVPQLCAYCNHLDVLLLRSKNPASYLSRFFMRSYYDHVALIIKSQMYEIFVFEAIESRGVSLLDLQTFLKINEQDYQQIAFRKLIVKDLVGSNKQVQKPGYYKGIEIERLENYLNSLLGKKYQLSLSKLLIDETQYDVSKESFYTTSMKNKAKLENMFTDSPMKKRQSIESQHQSPSKRHQRTFFCSELIADVYLKFGLIRDGRSRDFWPKDFEENQIKFRENTTFSPIMNVCFK